MYVCQIWYKICIHIIEPSMMSSTEALWASRLWTNRSSTGRATLGLLGRPAATWLWLVIVPVLRGVFDCSVHFLQKNELIHGDDICLSDHSDISLQNRFPLGEAGGEQIQGFGLTCTIPLLATFGQLMRQLRIPYTHWMDHAMVDGLIFVLMFLVHCID